MMYRESGCRDSVIEVSLGDGYPTVRCSPFFIIIATSGLHDSFYLSEVLMLILCIIPGVLKIVLSSGKA